VSGVGGDRQYNGRVYDPGTGFHDYGARMYWPGIARFVSADTYVGNVSNPASLNRYSYVLNNPYKYVDPDGRNPVALMNLGNRLAQWCQSGGCQAAGNYALAAAAAVAVWAGIEVATTAAEQPQAQPAQPVPATPEVATPPPPQSPVDPSLLTIPASAATATATATTMMAEHTKNARPSTQEKHQKGTARKDRDTKGGEKGDARRPYSRDGNKNKPKDDK
jgi:RHS repeat-associated protein